MAIRLERKFDPDNKPDFERECATILGAHVDSAKEEIAIQQAVLRAAFRGLHIPTVEKKLEQLDTIAGHEALTMHKELN